MKIKSSSLKLFFALIVLSVKVSAQSTGFINPTSPALPSGFSNAAWGMVSDTLWASVENLNNCRCPYLFLSWDGGATYTNINHQTGPFGTVDSWQMVGSDTDKWGHNWVDTEFSNANFRLKIANPSLTVYQGYSTFNFNIPAGAIINGIEVNTQFHGDSTFTIDYLNSLQVNVFYTTVEGIHCLGFSSPFIEVFPSLAHDKVTINALGFSQLSYSVYSMDGKLFYNKNTGTVDKVFSTDIMLNNFPPGIYILRLITNKGIEYRRFSVH
jgi:hypothetical protein